MSEKNTILKRLLQHWPARIAMLFILGTFVVAIFAYAIAPDSSPDANDMVVELSARPLGFKQEFLKIPKQKIESESSIFQGIFVGKPKAYSLLPINGYYIKNDSLIVRHYIDVELEDTLKFALSALNIPTQNAKNILGNINRFNQLSVFMNNFS